MDDWDDGSSRRWKFSGDRLGRGRRRSSDAVSLQDLDLTNIETSSGDLEPQDSSTHLLPGSDANANDRPTSDVYLGTRQFFLGSSNRPTSPTSPKSGRLSTGESPVRTSRLSAFSGRSTLSVHDDRASVSTTGSATSPTARHSRGRQNSGSGGSGGLRSPGGMFAPLSPGQAFGPQSPRTPDLAIGVDNLDAIRQGLDEALGTDGNGAWLADDGDNDGDHNGPSNGDATNGGDTAAGTDMAANDYFGIRIPTVSYPEVASRKVPSLRIDTSADPYEWLGLDSYPHQQDETYHQSQRGHDRKGSVSLAEEGFPHGRLASPSRLHHLEPFNLTSLVRNMSSRVAKPNKEDEPNVGTATTAAGEAVVVDISGEADAQNRRSSIPRLPSPLRTANPSLENVRNTEYLGPAAVMEYVTTSRGGGNGPEPGVRKSVLTGKSLMIFGPDNKIRKSLFYLLRRPWVEPAVFLLIVLHTIVLSYENAHNIFNTNDHDTQSGPVIPVWGQHWTDWMILAIFIAYTLEIGSKIIVFGLIEDAESQIRQRIEHIGVWVKEKTKRNGDHAQYSRASRPVGPGVVTGASAPLARSEPIGPSGASTLLVKRGAPIIVRSFTALVNLEDQVETYDRAFLRSSWNRVDFISVIAYWIALALRITGVERRNDLLVFHGISSIRILRLLNLTPGTASVLRAFKKAAPLLSNVVVFIGFFW